MRRVLGAAVAVWALWLLAATGEAQALACDSVGSGSFEAGSTWTCGVVPGPLDDVEVNAGHTVTVGASHTVRTLYLDGGTLSTPGSATTLETTGTFSGAGVLRGPGQLTAGSLVKTGAGTISVTAGQRLTLTGGGDIAGGTLCLQPPTASSPPSLVLGGPLRIEDGATAAPITCGDGTGEADVLIRPGGALLLQRELATEVQASVQDDGLVRADAGTLTLARGGGPAASAGVLGAADGARLILRGGHRFADAASISGGGTVELAEGAFAAGGGTAIIPGMLDLTGGTLDVPAGPGTLRPGTLRMSAGVLTSARTADPPAADLRAGTLRGAGRLAPGALGKTTAGTLTVERGFVLEVPGTTTLEGRVCLQPGGGPDPVLEVTGRLVLGAAADATPLDCGAAATAPLVQVRAGGVLEAQRDANVVPPVGGEGLVRAGGGDLVLGGGGGGPAQSLRYEAGAGRTLRLQGSRSVSGGGGLAGAGVLDLDGTLALGAGAEVSAGTVVSRSGTTVVGAGVDVTAGTVDLRDGVVTVGGAGGFSPAALRIDGGTLALDRPGTAAVAAAAGTLRGSGVLTASALQKTGAGTLALRDAVTLRIGADVGVSAGSLCLQDTARLAIGGAVTLTPSSLSCDGGTVAVETGGTLGLAPAGTVTSPVDVDGGTLDLDQDIALTGGVAQSGGLTRVRTARTVSATTFAASGGAVQVDGTLGGTLTLGGGAVLRGTGQAGVVHNDGGVVRPAGGLRVQGPFTQGADGTLEVGLTAGGADRIDVAGAAGLGGTLAVVRDPAFTPGDGDTFPVVQSASRTGDFARVTGGALAGGRTLGVRSLADGARLVVVLPAAPVNRVAPSIGGEGTLACAPGTWSGEPAFAFGWTRDGAPLAGASQATYTPVDDDRGHALRCVVTATNPGGSAAAISEPRAIPAPPASGANGGDDAGSAGATGTGPAPGGGVGGEGGGEVPCLRAASGGEVVFRGVAPADGCAAPVPTTTEKALAKATPDRVATAFGLPSGSRCSPRKRSTFRLKTPAGVRVVALRLTLGGRLVRLTGSLVTLDLRGRRGRQQLAIRVTTASQVTLTGRRTLRVCS